ncbi:unnamed protein product [Adineta steineri]|uniref:Uncharacterized protein n=1 Tax=Adineta steineri TaxID=433720 RepID=A0A818XHJ0_9BILA|nr:unnamed protein product [Adineta steineri]CAF3739339.1 unnamed protein product [Adineta steineri]
MIRLNKFSNISSTIILEMKKELWVEFLSIWLEIPNINLCDIKLCFIKCARLFSILLKLLDFYKIRKDLFIYNETCFICLNQSNKIQNKTYLLLNFEKQEFEENKIYLKHIVYLLLYSS